VTHLGAHGLTAVADDKSSLSTLAVQEREIRWIDRQTKRPPHYPLRNDLSLCSRHVLSTPLETAELGLLIKFTFRVGPLKRNMLGLNHHITVL
jgi:hypothetical protein